MPEQQIILSYFIEEAKAHLNTIEQGLLNLQNTLEDTEIISEVFQAAYLLKIGAAMLELDSIQQTSQHLENYFKVLKECPQIQADQKLEFLLWQVFDNLKQLIQYLEKSRLPKDTVIMMSEVEPVFEALNQHLELLVSQEGGVFLGESYIQLDDLEQHQEIELFNSNINAVEKDQAAGFNDMNEQQINASDSDADLSDLFPPQLEENEPLHELDLSAALNLEEVVSNVPEKELADNSPNDTSFNETLTFDNLFGVEAKPVLSDVTQLEFFDLFDQLEESKNCKLQEITPISFEEDANSIESWQEKTLTQAQIEPELEELWFFLDTGESLVEELPAIETTSSSTKEITAANNTDIDNFLTNTGEFERTFDDLWDQQLALNLTPSLESISTNLPESGEKNADISLADSSALDKLDEVNADPAFSRRENVDLTIDTTAIELFSELGEESDRRLNLSSNTAYKPSEISGISLELSSTEAIDDEFDDLEALLEETTVNTSQQQVDTDEFSDLDALLDVEPTTLEPVAQTSAAQDFIRDEFDDLEALLEETTVNTSQQQVDTDEFSDLDALLDVDPPTLEPVSQTSAAQDFSVDSNQGIFGDLDKLLEKPDETSNTSATKPKQALSSTDSMPRRAAPQQTMRVPVKHLDNVSNLVGELVINRNSLEQDQQRLRQSLENLLHQVHQLNGLGSRMQELYERSLMEASLNNIRQGSPSVNTSNAASEGHATGIDFDALEMDRFTGFHTLSQEMIELIVRVREASSDIEFVTDDTEQVARQFRQVTTQLQEGLTRSRMLPFAQIAERLPRAVRDIALKYGKQAELHIEGQESLIDKVILEQLYDPMTHLVNNSITHGIETPEERVAKGKPPVGKITIKAFHQGNQTVIAVSDDGAGIDADKVMTKAIQKGLISLAEAKTMSLLDAYNLLFHAGFSTKEQVDEFAGRGIGMDVVKTSLSEIRGTITTDSTLGKGTTFTIRLPLTLSIGKALCCLSDKAQIAFPMDGVEDMMDISPESIVANEEGQFCIPWHNSLLPLRPLKELLACNRQIGRGNLYGGSRDDDMISVVVLRSAGRFMAIQVDQVLGEQEIVIKQFEGPAPKPVGVAGATIRGDGRIMPIADVLELIDLATGRLQPEGNAGSIWAASAAPVLLETQDVKTEPMVLIVDDSITVRELLSMTFNKAGYRVEQARDGQEAWDKLRDGLPCDLIFCDIEMPKMDGLELLSRMQKEPHLSHLPIAMLTSRGADRHRQMAVQLGARAYFTKPYLEEALLDGAQRMLNGEVLVASSSNV